MHHPSRNPQLASAQAWIRDLHLYTGLLVGPFVVVFAVSAILFNHAWLPWGGPNRTEAFIRNAPFTPPSEDAEGLVLGRALLDEIGVVGEIGFVRRHQNPARLEIQVEKPGRRIRVNASLATHTATIEEKATGLWDAVLYLHSQPGMHLTAIRGNWNYMKLWGWIADATVYFVLFLTVSGIYLWTLLRAERKTGLLWLGGGVLSFSTLVFIVLT